MTHANHTAGSGRDRYAATSPPNVVESSDCCRSERAASEVAGIGEGHVTVWPNQSCYCLPNMKAPSGPMSVDLYTPGFLWDIIPPVSSQRLCAQHGSGMCYCLFWDVPSGLSQASAP